MNEALFELIEALAAHAQSRLRLIRHHTEDLTVKAALALEIAKLDDLLDKARHEHKGGA